MRPLFLLIALLATPTLSAPRPILGDFDAEIRTPDGHLDVPANLAALKRLGVNTYFYLIWHSPYDWDDLPAFATAAEREGIQVWVYVIPWSETKRKWGESKPFGLDFVRWSREIAKLSLDHRNVVGWVIDDFDVNAKQSDRFTARYVKEFLDAGRAINPRLKFFPLVYFQQDWGDFIDRFGDKVDGVVAAYPHSAAEIDDALTYLHGQSTGPSLLVDFPRASAAGASAFLSRTLRVDRAAAPTLSFYYDAGDWIGDELNVRVAQVLVDGRPAWSADANGELRDDVVSLDLAPYVRGKDRVTLEIGVVDQRATEQYPVAVRFSNLQLTGFDATLDARSRREDWRLGATGGMVAHFSRAPRLRPRPPLPMILMPAAVAYEHKARYHEPGTPDQIALKVRHCLEAVTDGKAEGVVTYCVPKEGKQRDVLEAVADEFRQWKASK